jgi:hypothetical protein
MSDPKLTVRYLGYQSSIGGGRNFEFSCALGVAKARVLVIQASPAFFRGPDRIALQEAAGICYETLKCRLEGDAGISADTFDLTAADVARHRKIPGASGARR